MMVRAASTYVYVKQLLHPGLLDSLVRAGAEAIEIFAARDHFDSRRWCHRGGRRPRRAALC